MQRRLRQRRPPPDRPRSLWAELSSPQILLFCLVYFCLVNTLAMIAVWTPLIVKGFNSTSSNQMVGVLAAIPQVCTIILMIVWGLHSDRTRERRWHLVLPMLLAAAGWILTAVSSVPVLQLLGVCMAASGSYTAMSIFWTTPDQVLSLGARAVGIAVINAVGNIGSAVNPLVVGWLKDLSQGFASGFAYAAILMILGALLALRLPIAAPAR